MVHGELLAQERAINTNATRFKFYIKLSLPVIRVYWGRGLRQD